MVRKVLQLEFNRSWESGGCLPHIVGAWSRNAVNYQHSFASWAGEGHMGTVAGRPHVGFAEHKLANRVFNKILRMNRSCFHSLPKIIDELRPDILHFHSRHDLADLILPQLSYRPQVVCSYHCLYDQLPIPKTAGLLLGVGKFTATWIREKARPRQPLAVLHNPFLPESRDARAKNSGPTFLTYANQRRATQDLEKAILLLQKEGHAFSLRCVGDRFRLPATEGIVSSRAIPQGEFLEIMSGASAYLCASYGTTFSVAVLEAMARHIPVICPWDIGALDLLPADCVISYESHSAEEMAGALRRFLLMPEEERAAMAARALAAASRFYDQAVITRKLERLYDGLFA